MRRPCSLLLVLLLQLAAKSKLVGSQAASPIFPSVPGQVNVRASNAVVEWNEALQFLIRDRNVSALAVRYFALEALGVWQALQANYAAKTPANETAVVGTPWWPS